MALKGSEVLDDTLAGVAPSAGRPRSAGQFADRNFKYLMIFPAVLVILLIGLFPII